jgi:hypothetical protein
MIRLLPFWGLAACLPSPGKRPTPEDTGLSDGPLAVVATTSLDYATGALATVSLDGRAVRAGVATLTGDPAVRSAPGLVIQLNRYGHDTVRLYRPGDWSAPQREWSVADGASPPPNPVDATVCGGFLWVALLNRDTLPSWDPATGLRGPTADLRAFADGDGIGPEPGSLVARDGVLYVALQRLDQSAGWVDTGGRIVALDCADGRVLQSWEAAGNPAVAPWPGDPRLLVRARAFGGQPGGLFALDPDLPGLTPLFPLDTAEDAPLQAAATGRHALLVRLRRDYSASAIDCVDLDAGTATRHSETAAFLAAAEAAPDGTVWLAQHWGWEDPAAVRPGLRILDPATCTERTDAPIDLGLGPVSLAFSPPDSP